MYSGHTERFSHSTNPDSRSDDAAKYPLLPVLDVKPFATNVTFPSTIPNTMPPHLGAPFNPAPPAWTYPDQRLPSLGAPPTSVDLTQPSQTTHGQVITIFDVAPQQGYEGTAIRITCDLKFPPTPAADRGDTSGNRIRLVFGVLAVETSVAAPVTPGENYIVSAVAPPLHAATRGGASWSVPVWLEAIAEPYGVIERVGLGEFHYLGDGSEFHADPLIDYVEKVWNWSKEPKVYVMACLTRRNLNPLVPCTIVLFLPVPTTTHTRTLLTRLHSSATLLSVLTSCFRWHTEACT